MRGSLSPKMREGGLRVSISDCNVPIPFGGGGAGTRLEEFTKNPTCPLDRWDTGKKEFSGNRMVYSGEDVRADAIKFSPKISLR